MQILALIYAKPRRVNMQLKQMKLRLIRLSQSYHKLILFPIFYHDIFAMQQI
jgi:hypothetical protein